MKLSSKLRLLLPQHTKTQEPVGKAANLDPYLGGEERSTPFGPCYVVTKRFPLTHRHGRWTLGSILGSTYQNLSLFGQELNEPFQLNRALFLDTETTGLAGGTGTYAFLVGLGYFTQGEFVVQQLLMRDYNEELALLHLLEQELQEKDVVVSFNGKTFDLPLLQTRFALSRAGLRGAAGKGHLDLLHMARRLWKHRLESCSLGSLEEQILGVTRVDDIPGFEIPQRYFDFLQTGDGRLLQQIVEHNLIDIISMAALLHRLHLTTELEPQDCDCPFEAEALAVLHQQRQDYSRALDYFRAASQLADDGELEARILKQGAFLLKRLDQHSNAAVLWRRALQASAEDLVAAEELAKYLEHRAKDLAAAQQVTRRALAVAWQNRSPKAPALEHRLRRLERKLQKQEAQGQ